mgnify:CR=1 FL=1
MAILLIWDELPDPRDPDAPRGKRCTVMLYEECLAHIVQRHISRHDGPWREWLTQELCDRLIQWYYGESDLDNETLQKLNQLFGGALRESLSRPLVLLTHLGASRHAWIAILPTGAIFVLRSKFSDSRAHLVTCYYPDRPNLHPPHRRWRHIAHTYLWRYAPIREQGGARRFFMPENEKIRFVQPENWGFDMSARPPVWRGALPDWPAAKKLSPKTKQHRIKLRQRRWTLPDSLEDSENSKHTTTTK